MDGNMERSEPGVSQPYLCQCGSVMDVAEIAAGHGFRCPTCGLEQDLERDDPALLRGDPGGGGVYDMLLEERIADQDDLPAAVSLDRSATPQAAVPAASETGHASVDGASNRTQKLPAQGDSSGTQRPPIPSTLASPETHSLELSATPPTPRSSLAAGARLGQFSIVRKVGQGGMGTVYEVFDNALDRTVAV